MTDLREFGDRIPLRQVPLSTDGVIVEVARSDDAGCDSGSVEIVNCSDSMGDE